MLLYNPIALIKIKVMIESNIHFWTNYLVKLSIRKLILSLLNYLNLDDIFFQEQSSMIYNHLLISHGIVIFDSLGDLQNKWRLLNSSYRRNKGELLYLTIYKDSNASL